MTRTSRTAPTILVAPPALVTLLAAFALTTAAAADFTHIEVRDVTGEIGTPVGLRSWRLVAVFDDPGDALLAVNGSRERPLIFRTNDPDGLYNDGGLFAGLKQEDFSQFPISAAWDSYVTIKATEFTGNFTDYSPGFLDNAGFAVIVGSYWSDDDEDGWFNSQPGVPADGGDVAIAQFTVGRSYFVRLSGIVVYQSLRGTIVDAPFCAASPGFTTCAADLDGSGEVRFDDLLLLLTEWGACDGYCPADLDRNDAVEFADLLTLLAAWGPCPKPGACCLPDGSCFQTDCEDDVGCAILGGAYLGNDTSCAEVTCLPASCCFPDGTCEQQFESDCAANGGFPRGRGTACADAGCADLGACCLPDRTCSTLLPEQCLAAGGSFVGVGTTCVIDCTRGACCLADGSCLFVTPAICAVLDGVYAGGGIACESVECP